MNESLAPERPIIRINSIASRTACQLEATDILIVLDEGGNLLSCLRRGLEQCPLVQPERLCTHLNGEIVKGTVPSHCRVLLGCSLSALYYLFEHHCDNGSAEDT